MPRLAEALQPPVEKLCARYLLQEKPGTHPLDAVAQFHAARRVPCLLG